MAGKENKSLRLMAHKLQKFMGSKDQYSKSLHMAVLSRKKNNAALIVPTLTSSRVWLIIKNTPAKYSVEMKFVSQVGEHFTSWE